MCNMCGYRCGYDGHDCMNRNEFDDQTQDGIDVYPTPAYESEVSMSDKVEVIEDDKADAAGIITKQSEVYVWNDQVFASYKSALAASKKDKIYSNLIKNYSVKHYPNYSKTQVDNLIKTWSKNPSSYSIPLDICFDTVTELLTE